MTLKWKGQKHTKWEEIFRSLNFYKQKAEWENYSVYMHTTFLYKKKDDSEGRTRSLEFGIKNHGDLLPGLQAESRNCQSVPSWISELLWSSDSSIASHLPLYEQEYLSGDLRERWEHYSIPLWYPEHALPTWPSLAQLTSVCPTKLRSTPFLTLHDLLHPQVVEGPFLWAPRDPVLTSLTIPIIVH